MIEHRLLKSEFEKNGIVAEDAMVDRYIAGILQESKQTRQTLEIEQDGIRTRIWHAAKVIAPGAWLK